MSGMSVEPIAAQVAAAEPERAPKNAHATMTTWARPPFIQPTSAFANLTIRRDIPPTSISLPASMKNGIAIIVNESTATNMRCANVATGIPLSSITAAVGSPMQTMRGAPRKSRTSSSPNRTIVVTNGVI